MLLDMDDDEFVDELSHRLGNDKAWAPFVDDDVVERTRDALETLTASLDAQLLHHGEGSTQQGNWLGRTKGLRRWCGMRLYQVNRQLLRADGSHTQRERELRAFAHELCEIIEDSNLAAELVETDTPFEGLNAAQWMARRREKRAARQEKLAA